MTQYIVVADAQLLVKHVTPPTFKVFETSVLPKFKPVTVTNVLPDVGPFTKSLCDIVGPSNVKARYAVPLIVEAIVMLAVSDPVPTIMAPELHWTLVDVDHDVVRQFIADMSAKLSVGLETKKKK